MTLLEMIERDVDLLCRYEQEKGVKLHITRFLASCVYHLQTIDLPLFISTQEYKHWRESEVVKYEKALRKQSVT